MSELCARVKVWSIFCIFCIFCILPYCHIAILSYCHIDIFIIFIIFIISIIFNRFNRFNTMVFLVSALLRPGSSIKDAEDSALAAVATRESTRKRRTSNADGLALTKSGCGSAVRNEINAMFDASYRNSENDLKSLVDHPLAPLCRRACGVSPCACIMMVPTCLWKGQVLLRMFVIFSIFPIFSAYFPSLAGCAYYPCCSLSKTDMRQMEDVTK